MRTSIGLVAIVNLLEQSETKILLNSAFHLPPFPFHPFILPSLHPSIPSSFPPFIPSSFPLSPIIGPFTFHLSPFTFHLPHVLIFPTSSFILHHFPLSICVTVLTTSDASELFTTTSSVCFKVGHTRSRLLGSGLTGGSPFKVN